MEYIDGFVAAVPTANKEAYIEHAQKAAAILRKHGALRLVECWGADIPDGVKTSFPLAVQCRNDETVVFSWIVWPSEQVRNTGMDKTMAECSLDADMRAMPFDGSRLIHGGFQMIVNE